MNGNTNGTTHNKKAKTSRVWPVMHACMPSNPEVTNNRHTQAATANVKENR